MCDIAQNDRRICGITAAMGPGVGLDKFAELYKERFFDVGIAEQHAVTFAGGLSAKGMVPVLQCTVHFYREPMTSCFTM